MNSLGNIQPIFKYFLPLNNTAPRESAKKKNKKRGVIEMVEFETLETKEVKFGTNKFLEVAKKRAKTPEGENNFISISKGFVLPTGQKRFKNALGFEAKKEVVQGLIDALTAISETLE